VSGDETDRRQRLEQARVVALFRYSLIQEVISPHLTAAQRGRRVRQLTVFSQPLGHCGSDTAGRAGDDGRPFRRDCSYRSPISSASQLTFSCSAALPRPMRDRLADR
jgi:hypothetical protein